MNSDRKCRNLCIHGRRTSIRLETYMWRALDEACAGEGVGLEQICRRLERTHRDGSLTAALRVYALNYHRRQPAQ